MIKKGWIISIFCLGGVLIGGAIAFPIAYVYNEQYQSLNESSLNPGILVDENHEVHLGTDEEPFFPGETRTLDYDVEMKWSGNAKTTVYFDRFAGNGQEYLSVQVTTDDYASPVQAITKWSEATPFTFEVVVKEKQTFQFHYSLARELGSEIDSLSFSFQSHFRVEK